MTTATTTHRNAKITRPYVAIHLDYIAPSTDIVPCTARKNMRIEGVGGAYVEIKAGEKFSLVRAGSLGENMFYIVREVFGAKKCTCPAMKPCRHEIAVALRKAEKQAVATVTAPISSRHQPRGDYAPLNGNRSFSFWR